MPAPPAALHLRAAAGEPGLGEHRSVWADALRSVADSWRFRARAGRISSRSLAGVLGLAESFDRAAAANRLGVYRLLLNQAPPAGATGP